MSSDNGGSSYVDQVETPPTECSQLFAVTGLNSADPAVLAQLQANDVLMLELRTQGKRPVVVATLKGAVAGTITGMFLTRLIECLQAGHAFVAIVLEVLGGRCQVQVRPSAKP